MPGLFFMCSAVAIEARELGHRERSERISSTEQGISKFEVEGEGSIMPLFTLRPLCASAFSAVKSKSAKTRVPTGNREPSTEHWEQGTGNHFYVSRAWPSG